jgi:hypothetical protein
VRTAMRVADAETYAQCPEGETRVVSKCLLIQGDAQLNTWRCSHRTARVITSARSGKLCAVLQSDQNGLYQCAHAFVHALWSYKYHHGCRCAPDAAVCRHGVERCSSRIRILVRVWTGMRPGCPGAVHSVTG